VAFGTWLNHAQAVEVLLLAPAFSGPHTAKLILLKTKDQGRYPISEYRLQVQPNATIARSDLLTTVCGKWALPTMTEIRRLTLRTRLSGVISQSQIWDDTAATTHPPETLRGAGHHRQGFTMTARRSRIATTGPREIDPQRSASVASHRVITGSGGFMSIAIYESSTAGHVCHSNIIETLYA
jgi:hypothetical protein